MQPKTLKTLGFVTIVVAVAAGVVSTMNRGGTSEAAETESGPLFPGLRDRINDVARIEVANKDGAFAVAREDGQWGIPDKGGFPVDFTKVKEVVLAVSKLDKVEKKTRNPELYERLGVDPGVTTDALRAAFRRRARELHCREHAGGERDRPPRVAGDQEREDQEGQHRRRPRLHRHAEAELEPGEPHEEPGRERDVAQRSRPLQA